MLAEKTFADRNFQTVEYLSERAASQAGEIDYLAVPLKRRVVLTMVIPLGAVVMTGVAIILLLLYLQSAGQAPHISSQSR